MTAALAYGPYRPWTRMKRKAAPPHRVADDGLEWIYYTSSASGRDHATSPAGRMTLPQGCDQCAQLISPTANQGARSFKVQRGLNPTTLYVCAQCVQDLCTAGGVPSPDAGN